VGRDYAGYKNSDGDVVLTHALFSGGVTQLTYSRVVDSYDVLIVDDRSFTATINTKTQVKRAPRPAYNPYNIRRDVFNNDCPDCFELMRYCGSLHTL